MSRGGPVVVLLGLAVILVPFHTVVELPSGGAEPFRTLGLMSDVPVALLAAAVVAALLRGVRSRATLPLALAPPIVALLAASLALHPSPLGATLVVRIAGAFVVAAAVTLIAPAERLLIAGALLGSAIVQALIAMLQITSGGPLHLTILGELQDPLFTVGPSISPRGTMAHHYVLAGIALVASGAAIAAALGASLRTSAAWLLATAVAIGPVGVSYSRTALLAVALGCAALIPKAVRSSRRHQLAIVALAIGTAVPAALQGDGWLARGQASLERTPDRGILLAQAASVIAEEPIFGIGPGRYLIVLDERERRSPGSVRVAQVPHSVPVLIAADAGIAAGLLTFALIAWLGWRALRTGAAATTAFVLFAPFVLNDHFPYTGAQGSALLGIWMGVVLSLAEPRS